MYNQLKEIYQGKKVFITGHTGFKGSWMLSLLKIIGAEVKGYALAPQTENDLFCLMESSNECDSIIDDLQNRERLFFEIESFQPDFVFHLAAQPLVRMSYAMPYHTFVVNAIGTASVLEAIGRLNKRCVAVMITTDKVYHNYEWAYPYRETDRLGGHDPYSASKACAEIIIDSYRNSFFNISSYQIHQKAIAVCRAGNVIGGGDWSKDRLIPDIVKSLSANEDIFIRNPLSVRPWQHVLEPVVAYLLLGKKLFEDPVKYSQAYNFGPNPGDTLPVIDIVEQAITAWGGGRYVVKQDANQPHEAGLLKLDISKAIAELGWRPRMNSEDAIRLTIEWYKQFFEDKSQIVSFTVNQIQSYFN